MHSGNINRRLTRKYILTVGRPHRRHFDDFSWGETRKVEGEVKGEGHFGDEGQVLSESAIPRKKWEDWERSRRGNLVMRCRRKIQLQLAEAEEEKTKAIGDTSSPTKRTNTAAISRRIEGALQRKQARNNAAGS